MKPARQLGYFLGIAAVFAAVLTVTLSLRGQLAPRGTGAVGTPQSPDPGEASPPWKVGDVGLGCGTFTSYGLKYYPGLQAEAAGSDAVLIGKVVSVDSGHWATSDGSPPSLEPGLRPTFLQVYRNLRISVVETGKVRAEVPVTVGAVIDTRVLGGTVGCRTFAVAGQLDLQPGLDVAVFLSTTSLGTLRGAPFTGFDVQDIWSVTDGQAQGPNGAVTVDSIVNTVGE